MNVLANRTKPKLCQKELIPMNMNNIGELIAGIQTNANKNCSAFSL